MKRQASFSLFACLIDVVVHAVTSYLWLVCLSQDQAVQFGGLAGVFLGNTLYSHSAFLHPAVAEISPGKFIAEYPLITD